MNTTLIEYYKKLTHYCSTFKLDGIMGSGGLLHHKLSLEDIYYPLRLTPYNPEKLRQILPNTERELNDMIYPTEKDNTLSESHFYGLDEPHPSDSVDDLDQIIARIDQKIKELDSSVHELDEPILPDSMDDLDQIIARIDRKIHEFELEESKELLSNALQKIILSPPGHGKSTWMKRSTLACIHNDVDYLDNIGLNTSLFPILVSCRDLEGYAFKTDASPYFLDKIPSQEHSKNSYEINLTDNQEIALIEDQLHNCLIYMLKNSYYPDLSISNFKRLISEKRSEEKLILMIDGFDEIQDSQLQEFFAKSIFYYLTVHPNVQLCLTSRENLFPLDYKKQSVAIRLLMSLSPDMFCISSLTPLDRNAFCQNWYRVIYGHDPKKLKELDYLINHFHQSKNHFLVEMASSPLHLTNILLVTREYGTIPENKNELLDRYLQLSLTWKEEKLDAMKDSYMRLAYVAYYMSKHRRITLDLNELQDVLGACNVYLGGLLRTTLNNEDIIEFVLQLEEKSGIIKIKSWSDGKPSFSFCHLLIQDYLTAYAIMNGLLPEEDTHSSAVELLLSYPINGRWQEVILIASQYKDTRFSNELVSALIGYVINPNHICPPRQEMNNQVEWDHNKPKDDMASIKPETNVYDLKQLLWKIITHGSYIRKELQQHIFRLLFEEEMPSYVLLSLPDYLQRSYSDFFKKYIKQAFEDSVLISKPSYYFIDATIHLYDASLLKQDLFAVSEDLFLLDDLTNSLRGLNMIAVLSWIHYAHVSTPSLLKVNHFQLSPMGVSKLYQWLLNENTHMFSFGSMLLKDLFLANSIELSPDFFTDDLIHKTLSHYIESNNDDRRFQDAVLAIYPFGEKTISFKSSPFYAKASAIAWERYQQSDFSDKILQFGTCHLLHCFDNPVNEIQQLYAGKNSWNKLSYERRIEVKQLFNLYTRLFLDSSDSPLKAEIKKEKERIANRREWR